MSKQLWHAGRATTRAKKGKWEVETELGEEDIASSYGKSNEPSQYKHAKQDLLGVTVTQPDSSRNDRRNELGRQTPRQSSPLDRSITPDPD